MTTWEHVVKVLPTWAGGLIFTVSHIAMRIYDRLTWESVAVGERAEASRERFWWSYRGSECCTSSLQQVHYLRASMQYHLILMMVSTSDHQRRRPSLRRAP